MVGLGWIGDTWGHYTLLLLCMLEIPHNKNIIIKERQIRSVSPQHLLQFLTYLGQNPNVFPCGWDLTSLSRLLSVPQKLCAPSHLWMFTPPAPSAGDTLPQSTPHTYLVNPPHPPGLGLGVIS